jgi:hypothetical protein
MSLGWYKIHCARTITMGESAWHHHIKANSTFFNTCVAIYGSIRSLPKFPITLSWIMSRMIGLILAFMVGQRRRSLMMICQLHEANPFIPVPSMIQISCMTSPLLDEHENSNKENPRNREPGCIYTIEYANSESSSLFFYNPNRETVVYCQSRLHYCYKATVRRSNE